MSKNINSFFVKLVILLFVSLGEQQGEGHQCVRAGRGRKGDGAMWPLGLTICKLYEPQNFYADAQKDVACFFAVLFVHRAQQETPTT